MKYSIEQRDPYLVLELPRNLLSSEGDDSFWSAVRAELCYMVCDKAGYTLIIDLRDVVDTDPRALIKLKTVVNQVAQLVAVLYVGPGPAVGLLASRGEAPVLAPMSSSCPFEPQSAGPIPLKADDPVLDDLIIALNADPGVRYTSLAEPAFHPSLGIEGSLEEPNAEVQFLMNEPRAVERRLASFEEDNTSVTLIWHPRDAETYVAPAASTNYTAIKVPEGTWLELWSGEIGVVESLSGEANFLILFERRGRFTRAVSPRRVPVSRISETLYRSVLEDPRILAVQPSTTPFSKKASANREFASGENRTRRKELAL